MYLTNLPLKNFTLLLIFCLCAGSVRSQSSSMAKILAVKGDVRLARPAPDGNSMNFINLSVGDDLFFGDVIKTKTGGRLTMALRDGSQAIISENTTV